jgi:PKD repeat protein
VVTVVDPNLPPEFLGAPTATPNPAVAGQSVLFSATIAGGADGVAWNWDFGDGIRSANGPTTQHAYASAGTYIVIVTATRNGVTSGAMVEVVIQSSGGGGDGGSGGSDDLTDTDGDGVSDDNEELDGSDPLDPDSFETVPLFVSRLAGTINFVFGGADRCNITGVIPSVSSALRPASAPLVLSVNGSTATFTLDGAGKGKGSTFGGTVALKLRYGKRDRVTRIAPFLGGDVPFSAKLSGASFLRDWNVAIDPTTDAFFEEIPVEITIAFGGRVYTETVSAYLSARAFRGGKFGR